MSHSVHGNFNCPDILVKRVFVKKQQKKPSIRHCAKGQTFNADSFVCDDVLMEYGCESGVHQWL